MIYLIDGHNLIGKMPDIDLADPDDEEKLVHRLQSWAAGDRKRNVHVVFDNGEFGGISPQLSGLSVKAQYARLGRTADDELIRFIKRLNNPQEYTLVTSDREILDAARKRRVGYILSEEFVELMVLDAAERNAPEEVSPEIRHDPGARPEVEVSTAEVEEWLQLFDKPVPRQKPTSKTPEKSAPTKKKRRRSPQEMKADGRISEDDLALWLETFGDVPATGQPDTPPKPADPEPEQERPDTAVPTPQQRQRSKRTPKQQKYAAEELSEDEVAEWLDIFGDVDNS